MVVTQPVGIPVEVEHDRSVQKSIEHRGGDGRIAEDLTPLTDTAVGGDDDRSLQIALRDNLNKADAASPGNGR